MKLPIEEITLLLLTNKAIINHLVRTTFMTSISQHNVLYQNVLTKLWLIILKEERMYKRVKSLAMRDAGRSTLVLFAPVTVLIFKQPETQQTLSSAQ